MFDFRKFQKDLERRSLFHDVGRHAHWFAYYSDKLDWAQRGWYLMYDGRREPIGSEELRRLTVRRCKATVKTKLDELKYDSERLAKLLFGEGYMD